MFITLSIDASTAEPSIALLDGERVIAQHDWPAGKGDASRLVSEIRAMTSHNGTLLESISLIAVGLGPGGFTGLRTSVAVAQALAMPSRTPVIGVCSADAAAAAIRREQGADTPVLIVGDARRDRLWTVLYPHADEGKLPDVQVVAVSKSPDIMTLPGLYIASPDWSRLSATLESIVPVSAHLIRHPLTPSAIDVGQLALRKLQAGTLPGPIEPIYVHPPVFTAPTFTG